MSEPQEKDREVFVDREEELGQLHDALDSAISGNRARFVLIQGDVGTGKTALVERFLEKVAVSRPDAVLGRAKCTEETELSGLTPFIQLLVSLSGRSLQRRAVRDEWLSFLKEVAPAWIDVFTGGVAGAIVTTVEESSRLFRRGSSAQDNVFVQFTNALGRLSEKRPLVAFIDGLQWAGTSSLKLLFHLAHYLPAHPVLMVCTYRPVEAMETGENASLFCQIRSDLILAGADEIKLEEGISVASYVAQRFPINEFPEELTARVQQATGGHPLSVSQLLSLWQDTGVLTEASSSDGQIVWTFTGEVGNRLSIPKLDEIVDQQIRRLEEELCEVLTCASVDGEDFTAQVIAHVRGLDEYQICRSLETLEHRYRLVREKGARDEGERVLDLYQFTQRYFWERIYQKLGRARRRILHRRVGECLEAFYQDRSRFEIAAQLAQHFREAHLPFKAAQYALMAARFEQAHHVWAEAEKWCRDGLSLLEEVPADREVSSLKLDLLEHLGYGYYYSGAYQQADAMYREALLLAREMGASAKRRADLCERLAEINLYAGQLHEALAFIDEGLQILLEETPEFDEMHFKLKVTRARIQGRFDDELAVQDLLKAVEEAKDLAPTAVVKYSRAYAHHALALSFAGRSQYREGIDHDERALAIARELSDKRLEAICLLNMADDLFWLHDLEGSMARASEGLEIAQKIGDLDELAWAREQRGCVLVALGRYAEAITELTEAITLAKQVKVLWNMPCSHADLALAHLGLSDLDSAYQYAMLGMRYAEELADHFERGFALDVLAQVEAARQDWAAAYRHFEQAIAIHSSAGDPHLAARAQRHLADALLAQGKRQEALALLQSALTTCRELGLEYDVEETQKRLDAESS